MAPVRKEAQNRLQLLRRTGVQGTPILMHRALRHIELAPMTLAAMVLLPILCDGTLWYGLDAILQCWTKLFEFWLGKMQLPVPISHAGVVFFGQKIAMPYPDFDVGLPSLHATHVNAVACVLLLVGTRFLPMRLLPVTYILRAGLIVQLSSSAYYWFQPAHLPYSLVSYMTGMLTLGLYFCFFAAPLLALVYYIFDIPFWQKARTTLLMVVYLLLVMPHQYLLHAVIIGQVSALFLPVLYLLFGALLNVLMFVSIYAWAMAQTAEIPGRNQKQF